MILVVGALSSGKKTFARRLGFDELRCAFDVHELVREGFDLEIVDRLCALDVVTCAEVGSGIVPIEASQRAWRECVGRLSCELAARAEVVVRMVCGIPVVIKGDLSACMRDEPAFTRDSAE